MPKSFTPAVKAELKAHGCEFVRQGKGDHELWYSPITDITLMVDGNIKSRHLANLTLKKAGISKKY